GRSLDAGVAVAVEVPVVRDAVAVEVVDLAALHHLTVAVGEAEGGRAVVAFGGEGPPVVGGVAGVVAAGVLVGAAGVVRRALAAAAGRAERRVEAVDRLAAGTRGRARVALARARGVADDDGVAGSDHVDARAGVERRIEAGVAEVLEVVAVPAVLRRVGGHRDRDRGDARTHGDVGRSTRHLVPVDLVHALPLALIDVRAEEHLFAWHVDVEIVDPSRL